MKEQGFLKKARRFLGGNGCFFGLIFMIVVATLINTSFLTPTNISNVLRQMSTNSIIALGMAVVIISGSIDLSVGSLYCLSAFISIYFSQYNALLAVVITLVASTFIGLINGLLVTKLDIHPWIATLSMMLGLRGLVLILANENTYKPPVANASFEAIARQPIFTYLNWPIVIMVVLTIAAGLFLKYTGAGRDVYARGGNVEAARMMGVNVHRTLINAHLISGFMTGVSGIILASRIGSVSPLAGDGGEMYAIASCVVGGVHLSGGRGKIGNVFIGAAIIGMLTNIFNMQNVLSTFWESVITGSLVLIVVFIQQMAALREERRKRVTEAI